MKNIHKKHLTAIRKQIKQYSLGKLAFLTCVNSNSWGFPPDSYDYGYQGIYVSNQDNTYWINSKQGRLFSLERIIVPVFRVDIRFLLTVNNPPIYISKPFSEFKHWINAHLSKKIYKSCQINPGGLSKKVNYAYNFFFIGNGIAALEKKKLIANLPELNKKILKIPEINKLINQEQDNLSVKHKQLAEKILKQLKTRLKKAYKTSKLPESIDPEGLEQLKIIKRVNPYFWYWPEGGRKARQKLTKPKTKKSVYTKPNKVKTNMAKKKKSTKEEEKACKHKWASLLARYKGKTVTTKIKICLNCGEMKVGTHSVKISRHRLSVEGDTLLKIPVGTDKFS